MNDQFDEPKYTINPLRSKIESNTMETTTHNDTDTIDDISCCRSSFTTRLMPILIYIIVVLSCLLLFVCFDIILSTAENNIKVDQNLWESRFWALPGLQTSFYVAILLTTASVIVRCSPMSQYKRPKRKELIEVKRNMFMKKQQLLKAQLIKSRYFLIGLFLLGSLLVTLLPSLTLRERPPLRGPVDRGNCTSTKLLKDNNIEICDLVYDGSQFVQLAKNLPELEAVANLGRDDQILETVRILANLAEYKPAFSYLMVNVGFIGDLGRLLDPKKKCVDLMFNFFCADIVEPCTYSSCTTISPNCSVVWYDNWIQCGIKDCETDDSCKIGPELFAPKKIIELMDKVLGFLKMRVLSLLRDEGSNDVAAMVEHGFNRIKYFARNNINGNSTECQDWKDTDPLTNEELNKNKTTCDPNITTVALPEKRYYHDSSSILLTTLGIGVIFVGVYGSGFRFPKSDIVLVFAFVLGLFVTLVVFVGGVNVERASVTELNSTSDPELQMWASFYYIISWMCYRHALLMFIPETPKPMKTKTKSKTEKHTKCKCFSSSKKWITRIKRFRSEVLSSRGKYYLILFYTREMLEVGFQLTGVINSSGETEAYSVYLTSLVVGANLIVVPIVLEVLLIRSGPTLATGVTMFVESLFDKMFLVLSVLLRSTKTTIGGTSFAERFLRHGLTLVPALSFALYRSSYIKLGDRYRQNSKTQSLKQLQLTTIENGGTSAKLKRTSSIRRQSLVTMKDKQSIVLSFVRVISVVFVFLGLFIIISITNRYLTILNHCEKELGEIANHFYPKFYFSNNGLITGDVSCFEEHYVRLNATGKLKDVLRLKENELMYSRMKNLTSIDVSNNMLESLPQSFGYVSNLKQLNINDNPNLYDLPYILCEDRHDFEIKMTNTRAMLEIDWSGQILALAKARNVMPKFSIGQHCIASLSSTLLNLSLADNQLACSQQYDLKTWAINKTSGDKYHYNNQQCDSTKGDSTTSYTLIKAGNECSSSDTELRSSGTLEDCHQACRSQSCCDFFVFGINSKAGYCYWEKTSSKSCPEGWKSNQYDFYQMESDEHLIGKNKCSFDRITQFRVLSYLNLRNNSIGSIRNSVSLPTQHILATNLSKNGNGGISLEMNPIDNIVLLSMTKKILNGWFEIVKTINASQITHVESRLLNVEEKQLETFELNRLKQVKFVDLEGNKLTDMKLIAKHLPESTEWLDLSGNNINAIDGNPFETLPNLVQLSLYEQLIPGLQTIEPGVFSPLKKLQHLILGETRIIKLHEKTFLGLDSLRDLLLYRKDTRGYKIEKDTFFGLKKLESLDLCADGLQIDPGGLNGLEKLENLRLKGRVSSRYTLIKAGNECLSSDTRLRSSGTLEACHQACRSRSGCEFFSYGINNRAGYCYWEKTSSKSCPEGWFSHNYDFYQMSFDFELFLPLVSLKTLRISHAYGPYMKLLQEFLTNNVSVAAVVFDLDQKECARL